MAKISIDFGTSNTTAARINPATGLPEAIIFDENGTPKMPTVIYMTPQGIPVVGQQAYELTRDAEKMEAEERARIISSTIFSLKKKFKPDGFFNYDGGRISHKDLVASVIKKVKDEVENSCHFPEPLDEVTITHPVIFEQWKKDMLCEAARKAGFSKVNLLEEPIAAAIGHIECSGLSSKGILVYDFGGGTFDVAYVMKGLDGKYNVPIRPDGDPNCGGDDIDRLFYNRWNDISRSNLGRDLTPNKNIIDISFLIRCHENKETISKNYSLGPRTFREIIPPPGFNRLSMTISPTDFDEMISPIIDRTIEKTQRILEKIKANHYPLEHAILIGGSSRIPLVQKKLSAILPIKPQKVMGTDIAVALGAIYDDSVIGEGIGYNQYCFCTRCGEKIRRGYKYCIYDGSKNYVFSPKDKIC